MLEKKHIHTFLAFILFDRQKGHPHVQGNANISAIQANIGLKLWPKDLSVYQVFFDLTKCQSFALTRPIYELNNEYYQDKQSPKKIG